MSSIADQAAFARLTAAGAPFELETTNGPHGPVRNFAKRDRSMRDLVDRVGRRGDAEFLVQGDRRVSFGAFASTVRGAAHEWKRMLGLNAGDRVAVLGANSIDWLLAMFSATAAGATGVALNSGWAVDEIDYALRDCEARFLVIDSTLLPAIQPIVSRIASLEALVIAGGDNSHRHSLSSMLQASEEPVDVAIDEHSPFVILYTSGTTGRAKGCITTHAGTIAQIRLAILTGVLGREIGERSGRREGQGQPALLATTPMFHVSGLHAAVGLALATGTKVVLTQGRFDPSEILELIEREHVTMWGAVPTMVHRVVDCPQAETTDLSSLEHVSIGGAPLPPDVLERARALLGVSVRLGNGYGLTETHGPITMNAGSSLADRPESVGRPTPLIDIRIVTDSGIAPAGTVGEVQVHGPTVTPGYWNRPGDNAQQIRGGWLRTGDAGYLDTDGYLYLVDRLKDMIIRGGENVYCSEVEAVLARIPEVDEAAVFGVPDPDLGERVEAAVCLVEGAEVDAQALRHALDGKLARYKIPDHIHLIGGPLPRNAAGKLLKGEIRRSVLACGSKCAPMTTG